MKLRDYQAEAIDALWSYFRCAKGNPLLILPTAAGKSVIQAEFMRQALQAYGDQRFMLVTHVKELIQQNFEKLVQLWPDAPAGIYSASLNSRDMESRIVYAGIQSVAKRAFDFGRVDLVIIDECHLVPSKGMGLYRQFLKDLRTANPHVKVIGLTATAYRMDSGLLTDGDIFTDVAYELTVRRLLDEGYLSPVTTRDTSARIDVSGVRTRAGEFVQRDLEQAVHADGLTERMLDEVMAKGGDRRSWLIFCVSVAHAEEIAEALRSRGIAAACLHGETPKLQRSQIISDYKAGRIRALTNCDILTTGFDAPATDLLVLLRPTKSVSLYVQIIGRGMRLSPETGKANCLVLDFAGNIERHGPVDSIVVKRKRKKGEQAAQGAPVKKCPDCEAIVSVFVRQCEACGYVWPERPAHEAQASKLGILTDDFVPDWLEVTAVEYRLHEKIGSRPSMRVDYQCGLKFISEWVCFEHFGQAQAKAVAWWKQHAGTLCPVNTLAALGRTDELRKPRAIAVRQKGKYPEVIGYDFGGSADSDDRQTAGATRIAAGAQL